MYLLNFGGFFWNWTGKKWFPYFLVSFTVTYNEQMGNKKRELFSNMQEFAGPSGKLSLLEVGCGTRANFKFYPPGCRVTCIDPNPNFEKFLFKSIAENRHLQFERFVVAAGENMDQVADGSVDVVVCTLVLCSVENQEQILHEACTVLRPVSEARGGRGPSVLFFKLGRASGYIKTPVGSGAAHTEINLGQVTSLIYLFINE